MDQKTVNDLEREIEDAIAGVAMKMGLKRLPALPSGRTIHLIPKAAVAVYQAVGER